MVAVPEMFSQSHGCADRRMKSLTGHGQVVKRQHRRAAAGDGGGFITDEN
jgi:hypothetical protein